MTMRDKIDGVLIDPDENGFHLTLSGEERDYNFTLDQTAARELYGAVATEIIPWLAEERAAQLGARIGSPNVGVQEGAYDPTDPKHPMYHDTMSEVWDNRDKTV